MIRWGYLRIELGDGIGLRAEEIVQSISGVCVNKAVANPFCGLDAVRVEHNEYPHFRG